MANQLEDLRAMSNEELLLRRREVMQQLMSHPDALADFLCEMLEAHTRAGFTNADGMYDFMAARVMHVEKLKSLLSIDQVTSRRREHT